MDAFEPAILSEAETAFAFFANVAQMIETTAKRLQPKTIR